MNTIPPGHEAVMAAIEAAAGTCDPGPPARPTNLPAPWAVDEVNAPVEGAPLEPDADRPVRFCEAVAS